MDLWVVSKQQPVLVFAVQQDAEAYVKRLNSEEEFPVYTTDAVPFVPAEAERYVPDWRILPGETEEEFRDRIARNDTPYYEGWQEDHREWCNEHRKKCAARLKEAP